MQTQKPLHNSFKNTGAWERGREGRELFMVLCLFFVLDSTNARKNRIEVYKIIHIYTHAYLYTHMKSNRIISPVHPLIQVPGDL